MPIPPVSTSSRHLPPCLISADTLSLVTPLVGSTTDIRLPARQLKRLDFPTLGLPTMAASGRVCPSETSPGVVCSPVSFSTMPDSSPLLYWEIRRRLQVFFQLEQKDTM